jgi:hypothetical protein
MFWAGASAFASHLLSELLGHNRFHTTGAANIVTCSPKPSTLHTRILATPYRVKIDERQPQSYSYFSTYTVFVTSRLTATAFSQNASSWGPVAAH